MKKYIFFTLFTCLIVSSCKSKSTEKKDAEYAKIEFREITYDYGEISYASDGKCEFEFVNSSNIPLLINTVKTSCGCTNPEWPQKPIQPGEKGHVGVSYNTTNTGPFKKTVTVYSNAENSPVTLFIRGNVLTP